MLKKKIQGEKEKIQISNTYNTYMLHAILCVQRNFWSISYPFLGSSWLNLSSLIKVLTKRYNIHMYVVQMNV